ncbi:MAG TPA: DUF4177 domain-containing protein [Pyrinomonadaceae bacterium]|nr:DUF4177 domain-containing protein [Pyrinomonadaceae bacterium]
MDNLRWQYKTVKFDQVRWFTQDVIDERFESKLNAEGEYGWEVVGVFPILTDGYLRSVIVIFKQPA